MACRAVVGQMGMRLQCRWDMVVVVVGGPWCRACVGGESGGYAEWMKLFVEEFMETERGKKRVVVCRCFLNRRTRKKKKTRV